jgi:hypothetical protein
MAGQYHVMSRIDYDFDRITIIEEERHWRRPSSVLKSYGIIDAR